MVLLRYWPARFIMLQSIGLGLRRHFSMKRSRYRSLSKARVWMIDALYFAAKVPTGGFTVAIDVATVAAARRTSLPLVSWTAIFTKAMALVARSEPALRQCYMPMPWPHIYEHPHCNAGVVVERQWQGQNAVFIDLVPQPENKLLREIDDRIRGARWEAKVEAIGGFRRIIRTSGYPLPVRRLLWRFLLYVSGRLRMKYCGGFLINTIPRGGHPVQSFVLSAVHLFIPRPEPDGRMNLVVFFDHRLMDGLMCARMVKCLEETLNDQIASELRLENHQDNFSRRARPDTPCSEPSAGGSDKPQALGSMGSHG